MNFDSELNAMMISSNGIEVEKVSEGLDFTQEAEQTRTLNLWMLPKRMNPRKEIFESLGFVFKDIGDEVLYLAKLPDGWTLESDGGDRTIIVDEKCRKRGSFFYKFTLDDRYGLMNLNCSFCVTHEKSILKDWNKSVKVVVKRYDGNTIYESGECKKVYSKMYFKLVKKAEKYLSTNYPEWKDPTKYWD